MQNRQTIVYSFLLIILAAAAVFGLVWANFRYFPRPLGQADFALGWSASRAWFIKSISPFDPSVVKNAQAIASVPGEPSKTYIEDPAFIYPVYIMAFYGPFSQVDYEIGKSIWMILIEVSFFLLILLCIQLAGWKLSVWETIIVILFSIFWFNGAWSIVEGKFDIVSILLIIGALYLILHKQDVGAGFLLALSTVNLDTSLLIVLYVTVWSLFTKRSRLFVSVLASFSFIFIISVLLLPEWPLQWLRVMIPSAGQTSIYQTTLSLIARAMPGVQTPLNIVLHGAAILYMIVVWIRSIRKESNLFLWTALMTLVITNLIGYRIDETYAILLLPGIFLILKVWDERWKSGGKIAGWIVLVLILAVSWVFYFVDIRKTGLTPSIMYLLPPITTLIGLLWIRWWAIHSTRMPLELMRDRFGL